MGVSEVENPRERDAHADDQEESRVNEGHLELIMPMETPYSSVKETNQQ